jgi:hypothetical protein
MELANSVGLSDYYKNLIMNGAMDVITVTDEDLQDKIDKFQDFYDKAMDCADSVKELQSNLKDLEKTKFDNVAAQFEEIQDSISHTVDMLNKYIDLADANGYFASEELYQKLIDSNQKTLSSLYSEQASLNSQLQQAVDKGIVKEGSEAWYDMQSQINDVNESIIDTIISIKEFATEIQNLNFEKFEWLEDRISNLTAESDFYIDLIEAMDKDLYDDNGKWTDEGYTVAGLHAQNFNTYLQQANDYADKIKEINNELANDSANKTLIEQKEEYIKAQREAVISAQDERKAILDLVKDGYDKQIDSLSDLIDKYKDLMSANKDAYDYEKSMAEKTADLAALQKQYMAWQGDISESGMKNRQELETQIL